MPDDKSKRDYRDRTKVSAEENYEVKYFAAKNDITLEQARDLIKQYGNDRASLEKAVRQIQQRF